MKLIICETSDELSQVASEWCEKEVRQTSAQSLFIPAGQTPGGLYRIWEKIKPDYLKNLSLLQIDEIKSGAKQGEFQRFFRQQLPSYLKQIKWIDQADQVAEIGLLGLGLNGHVGFHEPGLPSSFQSGCVQLSETTCQLLGLEAHTWGVTYGAGAFLRCQRLLLMVQGVKKREILKKVLDPQNLGLPAQYLLAHGGLTILADREALPEFI